MKITSITRSLLLIAIVLVGAAFSTPVQADEHFEHDKSGWFDAHHHHHSFTTHNHHRGYWENHGGNKVFINI